MVLPVLLLSRDDALYQHWSGLAAHGWAPVRGQQLSELKPWGQRGVLVLLDVRCLPDSRADFPADIPAGLQVVVASLSPNDPEGQRALVAGAAGYVHAYMPVQGLDRVLRHVMSGEIWVGKSLLSRMLSEISKAGSTQDQGWAQALTERERDVARHVALGHSNQAIATILGISERTVRAHLSSIFEKLGVTDRLMLALRVHGIHEQAPDLH